MAEQKSSYTFEDLLACARGEMFGPGNAQLPLPPMLMMDRVSSITQDGGPHGRGQVVGELDIKEDLWFFPCHFHGDPVMPGCLGLDALWQMLGFFLAWLGNPGKGRALSVGEVKFTGMVLPSVSKVSYYVNLKRVIQRKLVLGIADGELQADGKTIFTALRSAGRPVYRGKHLIGSRFGKDAVQMKRVVVTGMGIVSSIGNNTQEVLASLREAKSGIVKAQDYADYGFRCQVHGAPSLDLDSAVDRRVRRFMGDGAAWNYVAMEQAITDAGLEQDDVQNPRTGIIMGSGGPSTHTIVRAADTTREKGPKRVGPFAVPASMSSTNSATLAVPFGIKGVNYSISSACATSNHCIGNAAETIQLGKQDIVFAGGGEELDWTLSVLFDAMGAMSSKYNDTPDTASRAFDANRDGFVIAGGAGVVVLEELEHAKARGAKIYAEFTGYGATSDGYDMVQPSGEGAARCMKLALETATLPVDYINPHATSTPVGDQREIQAIREVFGEDIPPLSATKSLTGHSLGATGAQEAIYSLLMMNNGFICESANIQELDPEFEDINIVRERIDNAEINCVMSNSFGFGGTNATLVFQRYDA